MLKVLGSSLTRIMLHGTCVYPMRKRLLTGPRGKRLRDRSKQKRLPGVRGRQKAVTSPALRRFLYVQRVFYLI